MKIAGAVLICVSAVLCGFYFSSKKTQRYKQLLKMLLFMKYVRTEVCENKTPTKIICLHAPEEYGLKNFEKSGIFNSCHDKYDCLYPGEIEDLHKFCDRIGKGTGQMQRGEFDVLISKTEKSVEELRASLPKAKELTAALFLFFGILFVIIFI